MLRLHSLPKAPALASGLPVGTAVLWALGSGGTSSTGFQTELGLLFSKQWVALRTAEPTVHCSCFLSACPNCYEKNGQRLHLHHCVSVNICQRLPSMPFKWFEGFGLNLGCRRGLVGDQPGSQAEQKGLLRTRQFCVCTSGAKVPKLCLNTEAEEQE